MYTLETFNINTSPHYVHLLIVNLTEKGTVFLIIFLFCQELIFNTIREQQKLAHFRRPITINHSGRY